MAGNDFKSTVDSLLQGMNQFVSSKTVVGDALHVGDTIIVPLVDVSFGVGAGATAGNSKNSNSGGGVGGKVSPTAVLVISNGTTKMVNVKSADSLTKILDMVPDFVNRFTNKGGSSAVADDIKVEDLNIDGSK